VGGQDSSGLEPKHQARRSGEPDLLPFEIPWFERHRAWGMPILTAILLVGLALVVFVTLRSVASDEPRNSTRTTSTRAGAVDASSGPSAKPGTSAGSTPPAKLHSDAPASSTASSREQSSSSARGSTSSGDPSQESVPVGKLAQAENKVPALLMHSPGVQSWERVRPEGAVSTADRLMALPGFQATIKLDKGLDLDLWGGVPFFLLRQPVLESVVVLHDSSAYDLDFTLLRGRVILTGRKERATVRARLYLEKDAHETWDIVLHEGTEVALQKIGERNDDVARDAIGQTSPSTQVTMVVLKGEASFQREHPHVLKVIVDPPGSDQAAAEPTTATWDNRNRQLTKGTLSAEASKEWDRNLPQTEIAKEFATASRQLESHLDDKSPDTVLRDGANDASPASRILSIFCLGSIDDLPVLLDILADCKESQVEKCVAAYLTLHCWLGQSAQNDRQLFDTLLKRDVNEDDAVTVLRLLHGISDERRRDPATWQWLIGLLTAPNTTVAYLAYHHLYQAVPQGRDIAYDPHADAKQKKLAAEAWRKIIPDGKLPPAK
jgi:hypothetical protein